MEMLAYFIVGSFIVTGLFIVIAIIVEKNLNESHPVKKWWRKHVFGEAPKDMVS